MKLWIAEDRIAHHIALRGVTGVRKSVIIRDLCYQFLKRGWPIVALDVKCELLQEFYQHGDWILNPGDARCPRWALEEEAQDEMRATALAYGAFPDEPRDQPFFKKHPRYIAAHLIGCHHPTTQELAKWLADDRLIDNKLLGTDVGKSLTRDAGEMRGGVIATLSELGRSLRFWPNADEQERSFSVARWAKDRRGSIFLSSTPDTLDALRPSQSLMLDMLILAMQTNHGPGALILDEIGQMERLPKLETAMSLHRGAGNPIVLAFQEISQLETHYGRLWRAISSQPYTQIVFRTSEEESAKHAAGLLGRSEVQLVREGRTRRWFQLSQHNESADRQQERYCVSPGQIQSLDDGHFYLSSAGSVTKGYVDWKPPVVRAPRLIERSIQPQIQQPIEFPDAKIPYRKAKYAGKALTS